MGDRSDTRLGLCQSAIARPHNLLRFRTSMDIYWYIPFDNFRSFLLASFTAQHFMQCSALHCAKNHVSSHSLSSATILAVVGVFVAQGTSLLPRQSGGKLQYLPQSLLLMAGLLGLLQPEFNLQEVGFR